MPRQPCGTSAVKRRNYCLKFKLDVIAEYRPGVKGEGFIALSKKYGISRSAIRGWWSSQEELKACLKNERILTKKQRRLPRGGRKPLHGRMEDELHKWILERNDKGLRVKDLYISKMALHLLETMRSNEDSPEDNREAAAFKGSTGWLDRFKKRFNLVSRRHTTDRQLPENAAEQCRAFIQECQELIDTHKIKAKNIINMDQVPRYFETEPKSTICTRGRRNVLIAKGGTSHKRFTATFSITGGGKHLKPHILVLKRKTKPTVPDGVAIDVNKTGMWNTHICWSHFTETIINRPETQFYREPTLYLIDAYGPHLKWPVTHSQTLLDYHVHVRIVPACLTSLLQPLDVAVNRSYQADYEDQVDEYIAKALTIPNMQTAAGNPKCPSVSKVSEWALAWIKRCKDEDIARAFKVCGLVPSSEFKVDDLHPPLKALYAADVDLAEWMADYGEILAENDLERETLDIGGDEWFCPHGEYSLFRCLLHAKGIVGSDVDDCLEAYVQEVVYHMQDMPTLSGLFDEDDAADMVSGHVSADTLAVFAAADLERFEIILTEVDKDCKVLSTFVYKEIDPHSEVHLVRMDDFFLVAMETSC